jgi:hypothetical protein
VGEAAWEKSAKGPVVNLIEPAVLAPATPVEKFTATRLREKGCVDLDDLVEYVAHAIYLDETRRGAAVLDIGLFGSSLFRDEVRREIEANDGRLWRLTRPGA